ncbi:MAG: hypothetical protein MJZ20_14330 [Bacteroidaceae bacterium]|nr:hypothetical protein [Bacteroidaceae bacterium]
MDKIKVENSEISVIFNYTEFGTIRNEAGSNNFVILHRKCKKGKSMSKDSFIKYKSAEERAAAIRGMLNLKNEWLDYVQRREAELGLLDNKK